MKPIDNAISISMNDYPKTNSYSTMILSMILVVAEII